MLSMQWTLTLQTKERIQRSLLQRWRNIALGNEMRLMRDMFWTIGTRRQMNQLMPTYVTALRKLTKTCNYGTLTDSLICDGMVMGISDNSACKKRLQTSKLTLRQCIHICRSSETSAKQLKAINQEDVCYMYVKEEKKHLGGRNKTSPPAKPISESSGQTMVCKFCARQHPFDNKNCRAWGNSCSLIILLFAAENQRKSII